MSGWNHDYFLSIARNKIPGMSSVNKFGRNIAIADLATADIWDGGNTGAESLLWVAPEAARVHAIASSDVGDTLLGAGARTVRVFGLTDWTTKEVYEDIEMDGTTDVNTVNAYVIIHRMEVLTKGATKSNIGVIDATAATDDTVTARIRATVGTTGMAIYGLPSCQTAYMTKYYMSLNKSAGASGGMDASLLVNPEPQNELTNFIHRHVIGNISTGASHAEHRFEPPLRIPGPVIIKMQDVSGVIGADVSAGFDLILEDNVT